MTATTIRKALGQLQDDPENDNAWGELETALTAASSSGGEQKLLDAARAAHASRRESDAVARLLEIESRLVKGTKEEVPLLLELARVFDQELFDEARATEVLQRLHQLDPSDATVTKTLADREAARGKWATTAEKILEESKTAGAASFTSALLVSAAETLWRYGRAETSGNTKAQKKKLGILLGEIEGHLQKAVELDRTNRRAAHLLERVLLDKGDVAAVATLIAAVSSELPREERVPELLRLARLYKRRLNDAEKAAAAYIEVLDLTPGHPEATGALVDYFTTAEKWDELGNLYEEQLLTVDEPDPGMVLQVAMVNWKMRNKPDAAEPFFERIRRSEPAHPMAVEFFRYWTKEKGDLARLTQVLQDAEKATKDPGQKKGFVEEIARLADEGASAGKAIDQWRFVLRQDPNNKEAREGLKRLYRQTAAWNALADLLRSELERIPQDDAAQRLPVLKDIATVYRDQIKSDSALVSVLTQMVQLAPDDDAPLRELARVHEQLGRWRDLLSVQARLAELEPRPAAKAELYRAVARRWLDQFSNVQNAAEAYEKLLEILPGDEDAGEKLRELYAKRRAYRPLYDLLQKQSDLLQPGKARRDLWMEMARIAAERLERGGEAVYLYKRVLEEDSSNTGALDALEKQAERDRDYATVADVLERRTRIGEDDADHDAEWIAAQMIVLQRLGAVYADRLHDTAAATRTWRRVLDLSPGNPKATRVLRDAYLTSGDYESLTELYARGNDWEALAEVLSGAADRAPDATLKVALSFRAASVYAEKLNAPERAFRAYERVLQAKPDDARAAAALVPLYEKDEKWARLPALYEVLLASAIAANDEAEQLRLLGKLAETADKLQDRGSLFGYARRAYELAPSRPGAIEALETAAKTAGAWNEFATTLAGAKTLTDRAVRSRLAAAYANELGDVDAAVAVYRGLVTEDDQDLTSVAALDRLLRAHDRRDELRWLFDLRVTRANTKHKLELLGEWALLEEEVFAAPDRAIDVFRKMLELVPQHGTALRALARLLRATGDSEGAASILERDRDQRQGTERAAREIELARLYMGALARPLDALSATERALSIVKDEPQAAERKQAIGVLEDLLGIGETRATSAKLLEASYAASGEREKQANVLSVLIATAASRDDRLALYGRLAEVKRALGDVSGAFDVIASAASEYPGELPLWDTLSELAAATHREHDLGEALAAAIPAADARTELSAELQLELAERAANLFAETLGEGERAQPYLERILAAKPADPRAFERLKQVLTSREAWSELEQLYDRTIVASFDPSRKVDLLGEIALVAEEITGDAEKATGYYERILELEPSHDVAARALDGLYTRASAWKKLGTLLASRLELGTDGDPLVIKRRLALLYFDKLNEPDQALGLIEEIIGSDVADLEARDLAERALGRPELKNRASVLLEHVYSERGETRHLVRVLGVRLELAQTDSDKREILRRIAELRDEKLTDDTGSFEAYARLVPLAPADEAARARLLEIARRTNAYAKAAEVLEEAAKAADETVGKETRADILGELGKLYETRLNDRVRAARVYKSMLDLDPMNVTHALPAAQALSRIYLAEGKHAQLAEMLRTQIGLEDDAAAKSDLYGSLAELSEKQLNDLPGAVAAWRGRLDLDPADGQALTALDRLYERTSQWRPLVDILRAREQATDVPTRRRELLVRIAETLANQLTDVEEAIIAYQAVIDDFGAERPILEALEMLYEAADRYADLAETLETELGIATDEADRLKLLSRLGAVRRDKLNDLEGALEAYRQALSLSSSHASSRDALESLLDVPDARVAAARILQPLYEVDGASAPLLRVLEIEAEEAEGVDKLPVLAQAQRVAETSLGDVTRAFDFALRGLETAVGESDFPSWLAEAERLARKVGALRRLVEILISLATDMADAEAKLSLMRRIAELGRGELGDPSLARDHYKKALEIDAEDRASLLALEQLYAEANDSPALLDILARRAEIAETEKERFALLVKQAALSDEKLADKSGAIHLYEQALEVSEDASVHAALERLYAETERWVDLLALYERQLATEPPISNARRAELLHRRGRVREQHTHDLEGAFAEFESALAIDPLHPASVASLEAHLVPPGSDAAPDVIHAASRAAELLEAVYLVRGEWRKVLTTLEVRFAASQDPDERRALLRRLAKLQEEQEENYRAALETFAQLLGEDVTDESTWADLERLSRVANAEKRLAEIYAGELAKISSDERATAQLSKRTGELFDAQGDAERALEFYRRSLAFAPEEDQASFAAVDRLLEKLGRPAERISLYRDSLQYLQDASAQLAALHTIARLEDGALGDPDAAILSLRQALDVDETDTATLDSLAQLYTRRERWRDLADLLTRRAEQSALPEDEARYRLELGNLYGERLSSAEEAFDQYRMVVELGAGGRTEKDAASRLEALLGDASFTSRTIDVLRPLYERTDDWRKLAELNPRRLDLATDASEQARIHVESAEIWEKRGGDAGRAFEHVRDAFVLDPEDGGIREELDRLALATSRWDELAAAYERALEKVDGPLGRELLASLARLHDRRRDDPRKALDAWDRLFRLDESDSEPLGEMDALATLLSDWPILVRVLAAKAELSTDDEERASLWRRVGEARRDMLDDVPGAIAAYERALEVEPDSTFTLDNLMPLYESTVGKDERLVELYRRRGELAGEDEVTLKRDLLLQSATRYAGALGERGLAMAQLRELLALVPGDNEALDELDRLYTAEGMWPDLLENLRDRLSSATTVEARAAMRKRIADVQAKQLNEPRDAMATLGDVLREAYDAEAVAAIEALGQANEELRGEAAALLEPVLRAAERWTELTRALEMKLDVESAKPARAAILRQIAEVYEAQLSDPSAALGAWLRALAEDPSTPELHESISRSARLLGQAGWARYADALQERAGSTFEPEVTADLYIRLGHVADEELHDDARAATAYAKSIEQSGDAPAILASLDRLYGRLGDAKALLDVLERRIALENDAASQAYLHHRLATLQIQKFAEPARGLQTLKTALELVPDHEPSRQTLEGLLGEPTLFDEAFDVLERTYRSLGRNDDLAALYARRVDRTTGRDKLAARLELARMFEEDVGDPRGAQLALEEALIDEPGEINLLERIERLAEQRGAWAEAATALGRALANASELSAATRSGLWLRLAEWSRTHLNDAPAAEAAFISALALDPENLDTVRALDLLQREPGREKDRIATLRQLGHLESEPSAKSAAFHAAVQLALNALQSSTLAEEVLREALAVDDNDKSALAELTHIRQSAGDLDETVLLLEKRASLEEDVQLIGELRRHAAETTLRAGDAARAVKIYEELLELWPEDAISAERLRALYEAQGREQDLARLLTRQIETATSPEERTKLRVELARLQGERFGATRDAAETLRAILAEEPDHEGAIATLSALLERAGEYEELAELLRTRISAAERAGETAAAVDMMIRVGQLYESRLENVSEALGAFETVLVRVPGEPRALRVVARLTEARGDWARAASALAGLLDAQGDANADADPTGKVDIALRLATANEKLGNDAAAQDALGRALTLDPSRRETRDRLRALYTRTQAWKELADLLVGDAALVHAESVANGTNVPDVAPVPARASLPPPAAGGAGGSGRASMPPPGGSMFPPVPSATRDEVNLLRQAAEIHRKERNSPADAVPLLEQAAALVPQDRELLLVLCDTYTSASRERDAAQVLERVIASFGGKRTKELALYHHRLGKALAQLGDRETALAQMDLAFKIDPGSIAVLRDLGVLALEAGDLDRAQKTFRALLLQKLDAGAGITKGEVFFYLGEVSARQGDKPKAVQMMERAIENEPGNARAKARLAELKA